MMFKRTEIRWKRRLIPARVVLCQDELWAMDHDSQAASDTNGPGTAAAISLPQRSRHNTALFPGSFTSRSPPLGTSLLTTWGWLSVSYSLPFGIRKYRRITHLSQLMQLQNYHVYWGNESQITWVSSGFAVDLPHWVPEAEGTLGG